MALTELDIKEVFKHNPLEEKPTWNRYNIGIITSDPVKIKNSFDEVFSKNEGNMFSYNTKKRNRFILIKDRTKLYTWVQVDKFEIGHQFGEVYIDKNITKSELRNIVAPMCSYVEIDRIHLF